MNSQPATETFTANLTYDEARPVEYGCERCGAYEHGWCSFFKAGSLRNPAAIGQCPGDTFQ
jgi:hypothetical protein